MARKLRIEFPDAVYHVLNRGNYRRDLFVSAGEAGAFVKALEEAAESYGWRIYAYALMRNHYHIALCTPQPNLTVGMHWLQTTFATRFNRLHGERGHLFQGRYQALLVEDDAALARLVDYIHLNPVRAKIVAPELASAFRWSSLGRFVRGGGFPQMEAAPWLRALGISPDNELWNNYLEHLRRLALTPEEQERLGFSTMSRGWAIGTHGWRKAVAKDHAHLALNPGLASAEARALREEAWAARLEVVLREAGKSRDAVAAEPKSAAWKIELAERLRREAGAAITWIARELQMGSPNAVRGYLSLRKQAATTKGAKAPT
jgi:REP element-mobilizing transposase RayT